MKDETVAVLVRQILRTLRVPDKYMPVLNLHKDEDIIAVDEKQMNKLGWYRKGKKRVRD